MSGSAKERFEKIRDQYDKVDKQFCEFRLSPLAREHKEVLGDFIHETRRLAGNVGRCLRKGTLPKHGEPSKYWKHYNTLLTNMGIMELISALGSACGPDGIKEDNRRP